MFRFLNHLGTADGSSCLFNMAGFFGASIIQGMRLSIVMEEALITTAAQLDELVNHVRAVDRFASTPSLCRKNVRADLCLMQSRLGTAGGDRPAGRFET